MLTAVEHLGRVGVGVTAPQFFRADDGKIYVVKLQNNRLGARVLVSEFLAAKFGKIMGLRFPPSDVIFLDEQVIEQSWELVELGALPGRHFASRYLEDAVYLGKNNIDQATNTSEMAGVILFDHLFHNADRSNNRKNLLLRRENDECRIYAIDNSHLFKSGRWTLESVEYLGSQLKIYYKYSFGLLLKDRLTPEDFLPYLAKVTSLSDAEIDDLVEEIPAEWLPEGPVLETLMKFIKLRRDLAEEIRDKLCKYIPTTRGGRRRWGRGRVIGSLPKKSGASSDMPPLTVKND